jgi:hypothetical protein
MKTRMGIGGVALGLTEWSKDSFQSLKLDKRKAPVGWTGALSFRKNPNYFFTLLFTTLANSNMEICFLPANNTFSFSSALIILLFLLS